jgi:HAD superfamily hydrolase (TIGR01509 family)
MTDADDRLPAAVLWDLDGTLVDGERLWEIAHREVARGLGGTLGAWALRRLVGADLETSVAVLLAETGHAATPELAARTREQLLAAVAALYAGGVTWMPGAHDALHAVRAAGIPTALVTNTTRRVADLALDAMGREHFDVTVCADEVASGKPSPEPYLRAAALLGVDPARCVAVEDSPDGALAARRAGAAVLIVPGAVPVPGGAGRVHLPSLTGFDPADLAGPDLGGSTALTG